MTRPDEQPTAPAPDPRDHPYWPVHVLDQAILVYAVIGLLLVLAVLRPFPLHGQADALVTPPGIKPEWYFLPLYQFLKYVPRSLGVVTTGLFFAAMMFWPFIDQALVHRFGPRRWSGLVGGGLLALMVTLALLGAVSERTFNVAGRHVRFDLRGVPHLLQAAPEGR